ncbi:hypothetical protein SAMN05421747_101440 [Parapedobacter composti]|uniref:Cytochrome C and Quinol oxidase polypeptide I n=1 Tax=Parapedobacter composti TaxID=623281 RepID=A0A1I1EA21_9SPHI|nr:hypothetical protein [Parapedobacter composti]SFB83917.1 hypothetical protein SAMN05421747_101440 [Parapedobacter composti]
MYTGIKHLHSTLAYVLLAGLIISILYVLFAYLQKRPYNRKMALLGLICAHLQFLVGIITYFVSPYGYGNISGEAMKDSIARLYFLEHPLIMLIAVVLITVGYSRAKRLDTPAKQNASVLVFYAIGLILVLSRIPWHVWPRW